MPPAARVTDNTGHGNPLGPGPGSLTVKIGFMPAWRALPSGVGGAVQQVSEAMNSFMTKPVMTPANAAADIAKISSGLIQAAGQAGAEGNPAALGTSISSIATVNTTNATLSTAWCTASAAPGGQPAANQAYTEGIKAAMATAASAVFSSIGGLADTHICPLPCPIPPHGPGMVTKGSSTVMIDNLPACRLGDKVMEACGGPDPIAVGCPSVMIGDSGGGGGGGGAAGGGAQTQEQEEEQQQGEQQQDDDRDQELQQEIVKAISIKGPSLVAKCGPEVTGPLAPESPDDDEPEDTWLGVRLMDSDGTPVANEQVHVTLEDGQVRSGATDDEGRISFEGLQPGRGEVTFPGIPDHDDDDSPEQRRQQPQEEKKERPPSHDPGKPYEVRKVDDVVSAADAGEFDEGLSKLEES